MEWVARESTRGRWFRGAWRGGAVRRPPGGRTPPPLNSPCPSRSPAATSSRSPPQPASSTWTPASERAARARGDRRIDRDRAPRAPICLKGAPSTPGSAPTSSATGPRAQRHGGRPARRAAHPGASRCPSGRRVCPRRSRSCRPRCPWSSGSCSAPCNSSGRWARRGAVCATSTGASSNGCSGACPPSSRRRSGSQWKKELKEIRRELAGELAEGSEGDVPTESG
jgi:hypothetical protein